MRHYVIILLVSITALLTHGYQFAVSDQQIFIPYSFKAQNSQLFQNDMIFSQKSANLSVFYPTIGLLLNYIDIQTLFLILYFICQFALLAAFYKLSVTLLQNKNLAYLSLLPFLMPKFIGGTAISTYDTFFGYRLVGNVFLIFLISAALEGKISRGIIFAIASVIFHPLSIAPNVSLFFVYIKRRFQIIFLAFFLITIIPSTFLANVFTDHEWLSVLNERTDYLFVSTWSYLGWGALFLYLFILAIFTNQLKQKLRKKIYIILVVSTLTAVGHIFVLEILKVPLIAQLQLIRSFQVPAYIAIAMSPLFLIAKSKPKKIIGIIAFVSLSANLFWIFLASSMLFLILKLNFKPIKAPPVNSRHLFYLYLATFLITTISQVATKNIKTVQYPKKVDEWIALQYWVKNNTKPEEKYLVAPNLIGFRIFSQRAIAGDIKDGATALYDRNYAIYWSNLVKSTADIENFNEGQIKSVARKYQTRYIILQNKLLNLKKTYQNNRYTIYRVD